MIYSKDVKGYMDKLCAILLAVLLLPIFIVICLLLLITQGRPIFFIQERSGKYMRKFRLVKFRTLVHSEIKGLSIMDRKFTFFGRFMRIIGIDELPQLFNIIVGEMSFIGPRPLPIEYENLYSAEQKQRFLVKPGLTGLAQVNGKNNITWGRRFDLDIWYIKHVSLFLDFKIVLLTILHLVHTLLKPESTNKEMPVFNGSNLG